MFEQRVGLYFCIDCPDCRGKLCLPRPGSSHHVARCCHVSGSFFFTCPVPILFYNYSIYNFFFKYFESQYSEWILFVSWFLLFKSQVFPWSDPRHSAVEWPIGCAWAFLGALQQPELSEATWPWMVLDGTWTQMPYPLVNVYIAMEHHHFWWVNQLNYHLYRYILWVNQLLSSILNDFYGPFDSY